jgi:hypothetical protein
MTKERVALPFGLMVLMTTTNFKGNTALPFVIPSDAEGSAVLLYDARPL